MANENVKIPEAVKEAEKAQEEQETGLITIKLRAPLDYNGKVYEEIHMDMDGLTGRDSMDIEAELMSRKKGAVIYGALNNDYLLAVAAKSCQEPLGSDAFLSMKLKDFNRVKQAVQNFLLK